MLGRCLENNNNKKKQGQKKKMVNSNGQVKWSIHMVDSKESWSIKQIMVDLNGRFKTIMVDLNESWSIKQIMVDLNGRKESWSKLKELWSIQRSSKHKTSTYLETTTRWPRGRTFLAHT